MMSMTLKSNLSSAYRLLLFLFFLILLKDSFGEYQPKVVDGTKVEIGEQKFEWNDQKMLYRYIVKEAGQSLQLHCNGDNWVFPYESNAALVGWGMPYIGRYVPKYEPGGKSSSLSVFDLTDLDTGVYGCGNSTDGRGKYQGLYVYVKRSRLFLQYGRGQSFLLGKAWHKNVIPCRTTSPIDVTKVRLLSDNEEWTEVCSTIFGRNLIRTLNKANQSSDSKELFGCIPMWKHYDPRYGFTLDTASLQLHWSQFHNQRFRCEYETEKTDDYFIEVNQIFPSYRGETHTAVCSLSTNQNVTFNSYSFGLNLTCTNCNSTLIGTQIDKIIDQLGDEQLLKNLSIFWRLSEGRHDDDFCKWIRENCSTPLPFAFEVLSDTESEKRKFLLTLVVILLLLFLLAGVILVGYYQRQNAHLFQSERGLQKLLEEERTILENLTRIKSAKEFEKRQIDSGTYGVVFELIGYEPPAVVKCMNKKNQASLLRFQQEFEILKKIQHEQVVKLIRMETDEELNEIGLIMEFCQRGNLKNLLKDSTIVYSLKTVISWSVGLFDALGYMFTKHNVVHRDIKPDNIFVTHDFSLKIGDFGLAKYIEGTCTGTCKGTERYMSPSQSEMTNSFKDSHRNDVYSLGLVLWELIERRTVLSEYGGEGDFQRDHFLLDILQCKIEKLDDPDCSDELQEIVKHCTTFDRCQRPMAREVLAKLFLLEESDPFIESLKLIPFVEAEQRKVIRPIGFDGMEEWKPIKSRDSSYNSVDLFPAL